MRYIALILLLFAASLTMPMVYMEDGDEPVSTAPHEVLSDMSALPRVQSGEKVGLIIASFRPPERTPVKTWFGPAVNNVLPDAPVYVPVVVAKVDTLDPKVGDSVVHEAEEMLKNVEPAISSSDLRGVSATALNVRAGPSSRYRVVGALTFGEQTVVTGVAKNGWVPVRAMATELEGWVFSRFLAPLDGT